MTLYGTIYKIINKINGKCYIGQTRSSLQKRFSEHIHDNRKYKILHKVAKKYGVENLDIYPLVSCFDQSGLDHIEELLISEFNTLTPNGYNLKLGGNHSLPSETSKQKQSNTMLIKWQDESYRSGRLKQLQSDENRQRLSDNIIKRFADPIFKAEFIAYRQTPEYRLQAQIKKADVSKPVIRIDMQTGERVEYPSASHAAKINNLMYNHIAQCCHYDRISHGGFKWCYVGQEPAEYIKRDRAVRAINVKTGEVRQYSRIVDAEKDGFSSPNICGLLAGKGKTHKGYRWEYI